MGDDDATLQARRQLYRRFPFAAVAFSTDGCDAQWAGTIARVSLIAQVGTRLTKEGGGDVPTSWDEASSYEPQDRQLLHHLSIPESATMQVPAAEPLETPPAGAPYPDATLGVRLSRGDGAYAYGR